MATFNMSSAKRIAKAVKRVEQTAWDLTGTPRARAVGGSGSVVSERISYFMKISSRNEDSSYNGIIYSDPACTLAVSNETQKVLYLDLLYPNQTFPADSVIVVYLTEIPCIAYNYEAE